MKVISLYHYFFRRNTSGMLLDECCQIIYHLEGFSLFNLCHSHVLRRRLALLMLRECKSIGELTKCFRPYANHNYVIDVLDLAAIFAMKQLHLQCFHSGSARPDLGHLIEQSVAWEASVNTASFNGNLNESVSSVLWDLLALVRF